MESAPASRPAAPVVSTTALLTPAPATPSTRLTFETKPSFTPNTIARRLPPKAWRWRAPTSASEVGIGCPAVACGAL
jgi:hypothetical protein